MNQHDSPLAGARPLARPLAGARPLGVLASVELTSVCGVVSCSVVVNYVISTYTCTCTFGRWLTFSPGA